jgi:stalled ribosome rescue protein Dom34
MHTNHAVIWLDHQEAHILFFDQEQNQFIHSNAKQAHLHHKANVIGSGNAPEDRVFFESILAQVGDVKEILLVGPGFAKGELQKYAEEHHGATAKKIVGVKTVDHPTDGQVLAYAKEYFKRFDRLQGDQ